MPPGIEINLSDKQRLKAHL